MPGGFSGFPNTRKRNDEGNGDDDEMAFSQSPGWWATGFSSFDCSFENVRYTCGSYPGTSVTDDYVPNVMMMIITLLYSNKIWTYCTVINQILLLLQCLIFSFSVPTFWCTTV